MTIAVARSSSRDVEIEDRVGAIDWASASTQLDAYGWAMIKKMLSAEECHALANLYGDDHRFRSHVIMARHGFGQGEYKYFDYPLPDIVAALRSSLYSRLAPLANRWNERLGNEVRYPEEHAGFLARCHAAGQRRPTPLLLQYGAGDYNCLHQDLYGEHVFPFQVAFLLAEPEKDFTGGEFVLTEQRPRMQSRAEGRATASGRWRHLRRPPSPGRGDAGDLSGESAARREPDPLGPPPHPGRDLPRRAVSADEDMTWIAGSS